MVERIIKSILYNKKNSQIITGLIPFDEGAQPAFKTFVCSRNNGILYENELVQIGVKSEFIGCNGKYLVFLGIYQDTQW